MNEKVGPDRGLQGRQIRTGIWLQVLLIVVTGLLVYSNSLHNDFVYDDIKRIRKNDFIRDWSNLPTLFDPAGYYRATGEDNYIPVTTLSLFVDHSLSGLDPFGYHMSNLLFHVLNSILVYLIVLNVLNRPGAALLSSLLFITHPVHTESVDWITGRTDLLCALFMMIAFLLYLKCPSRRGGARFLLYAFSLLAFIFSLFAKEMSVTLLPIIVLIDLYSAPGDRKALIKERLPLYSGYLVITILHLAGMVLLFNKGVSDPHIYPGWNTCSMLLTMSNIFTFYLKKLVFPVNLCIYHIFPVSQSLLDVSVLISIGILFALVITAIRAYRRCPGLTFSIAYFFITILPVSNIIPIAGIVAERYLYIPSVGFCLLAASGLFKLSEWFGRNVFVAASIALLVLYSVGTVKRNEDWKDNITIWSQALEMYPNSGKGYVQRADSYAARGEYRKAIEDYTAAHRLNTRNPIWILSRGLCLARLGEFERAHEDFTRAIELRPEFPVSYYNRGNLSLELNRFEDAVSDFDKAIELNPEYVEAYNNRGSAFMRMENWERALQDFSRAIELNPRHMNAYQNRSVVYRQLGMDELAERDEKKRMELGSAPPGNQ